MLSRFSTASHSEALNVMYSKDTSSSVAHSIWNFNTSASSSPTVTSATFASSFIVINAASLDHTVIVLPSRSHT
jgi:hypothetical protein